MQYDRFPAPERRSQARPPAGLSVAAASAALVFLLTGCGGDATATAPETTTSASSAASTSASPTASTAPSAAPDAAPVDGDAVPAVAGTGTYAAPHAQPAYATAAADLLATLPIKGRAPKTGYDRDQFGQAWADVDRNGCDTRNDMLGRDLTNITYVNSVPCKVAAGTLADPYTATTIGFVRGQDTSSDVQVDHVVALSDAWQKGAQQLSLEQRAAFANDPLNLQSTDGPTNQQKGDGDAATWLPPNSGYRCDYVARQISVKATYSLWVTQAEHDAMARTLANCSGQLAPTNQPAPVPAPEPTPTPAPAPTPKKPAKSGVYYRNCSEVRAAGADPIHPGDPGFQPKFDGNNDGVGCD